MRLKYGAGHSRCRSPVSPIQSGLIASTIENFSSSPIAPILRKLRELVPQPLQVTDPLVKFEFIRMPDSTGFGDYTERTSHSGFFSRPQGRILPLHVS
jgi:Acetoacetate decarboxylase (ADC)